MVIFDCSLNNRQNCHHADKAHTMQVIISFDAIFLKLTVMALLFFNSYEGKDKFLFTSMKLFKSFKRSLQYIMNCKKR